MTEKGVRFFTEMSNNAELKAKIEAVLVNEEKESIKKAIPIAKEFGFDLTEEDLTADQASAEGKMADEELDAVAGGVRTDDFSIRTCRCLSGNGGGNKNYCEAGIINRTGWVS